MAFWEARLVVSHLVSLPDCYKKPGDDLMCSVQKRKTLEAFAGLTPLLFILMNHDHPSSFIVYLIFPVHSHSVPDFLRGHKGANFTDSLRPRSRSTILSGPVSDSLR